jgi:hypothetical protein
MRRFTPRLVTAGRVRRRLLAPIWVLSSKGSSRNRCHHLLKTFYGWHEKQLPDGTLILTSPAGHTYVTTPGSALLFPSLCGAVGGMPAPEADLPSDYCGERSAMMPKRRRTRAQNRAHRIAAERRDNRQARQARKAARASYAGPAPPDDDDPPPF